ncbi:hypothetical protein BLNAU_11327 [Blattamonas nauphoetae]|uniref:Uncharacterized protein n=1 Tax=Blattamonas nauphoetae TaxID=2049346 RepID=A0ABQ9XSQ1_9EUKA|nr:hypothetical protein BLNAU_11327 [Blattamonas nauphoetae]
MSSQEEREQDETFSRIREVIESSTSNRDQSIDVLATYITDLQEKEFEGEQLVDFPPNMDQTISQAVEEETMNIAFMKLLYPEMFAGKKGKEAEKAISSVQETDKLLEAKLAEVDRKSKEVNRLIRERQAREENEKEERILRQKASIEAGKKGITSEKGVEELFQKMLAESKAKEEEKNSVAQSEEDDLESTIHSTSTLGSASSGRHVFLTQGKNRASGPTPIMPSVSSKTDRSSSGDNFIQRNKQLNPDAVHFRMKDEENERVEHVLAENENEWYEDDGVYYGETVVDWNKDVSDDVKRMLDETIKGIGDEEDEDDLINFDNDADIESGEWMKRINKMLEKKTDTESQSRPESHRTQQDKQRVLSQLDSTIRSVSQESSRDKPHTERSGVSRVPSSALSVNTGQTGATRRTRPGIGYRPSMGQIQELVDIDRRLSAFLKDEDAGSIFLVDDTDEARTKVSQAESRLSALRQASLQPTVFSSPFSAVPNGSVHTTATSQTKSKGEDYLAQQREKKAEQARIQLLNSELSAITARIEKETNNKALESALKKVRRSLAFQESVDAIGLDSTFRTHQSAVSIFSVGDQSTSNEPPPDAVAEDVVTFDSAGVKVTMDMETFLLRDAADIAEEALQAEEDAREASQSTNQAEESTADAWRARRAKVSELVEKAERLIKQIEETRIQTDKLAVEEQSHRKALEKEHLKQLERIPKTTPLPAAPDRSKPPDAASSASQVSAKSGQSKVTTSSRPVKPKTPPPSIGATKATAKEKKDEPVRPKSNEEKRPSDGLSLVGTSVTQSKQKTTKPSSPRSSRELRPSSPGKTDDKPSPKSVTKQPVIASSQPKSAVKPKPKRTETTKPTRPASPPRIVPKQAVPASPKQAATTSVKATRPASPKRASSTSQLPSVSKQSSTPARPASPKRAAPSKPKK